MRATSGRPPSAELRHDLCAIRGNGLWFAELGMAPIAPASVTVASPATGVAVGSPLLMGGSAGAIVASWCRGWSGSERVPKGSIVGEAPAGVAIAGHTRPRDDGSIDTRATCIGDFQAGAACCPCPRRS